MGRMAHLCLKYSCFDGVGSLWIARWEGVLCGVTPMLLE